MRGQVTRRAVLFAVGFTLLGLFSGTERAEAGETDSVTVFAAASTTNALLDIGRLFESRGLGKVICSFASSSTLAKQIEQGAPADIYVSANRQWMDYLQESGVIDASSRFDLLSNRIVLIVPVDSVIERIDIHGGLDLPGLLQDGLLAMGDPDHVPAGIYGKQALEKLGLWEGVQGRVARSKDVRAALALVERGEAPIGLVYATDAAITDRVRVVGVFDPDSHPPIVYPVALVTDRVGPVAERLMAFLRGPEARAAFERYGFTVR
jgi:molybdate transport system substrate-binding protein